MPQPGGDLPRTSKQRARCPQRVQPRLKVGIYFWALLFAWSAAVAGSLVWHFSQTEEFVLQAARTQARTAFEKDVLYRSWNSNRNGVYATQSDITPSNPFLDDPARDVVTTSGLKLTKINPAYMTRQVHELGTSITGVLGHITSNNPIRPGNRPDAWEKVALTRFERGANEVWQTQSLNGSKYLRFMKPLVVEKSCLPCHGKQGYKVGQIRGGISVSVPLAPFLASARESRFLHSMTHLVLWFLGAAGLVLCIRTLNIRLRERHAMELELHRLATTDPLTGASNRGHLMERADEEFQRAKRYQTPLSVLMLDIDHFKKVNDVYGHQAGDQALKQIVKIAQASMRQSDLFGRYGGEEFMALLTHTDEPSAMRVAENLCKTLAGLAIQNHKGPIHLTVSIGVSQARPGDLFLDEVIRRADESLYAAKQGGRNRVVLYGGDETIWAGQACRGRPA
jgi:diguanylate cyclase (GGDEF)-like protein